MSLTTTRLPKRFRIYSRVASCLRRLNLEREDTDHIVRHFLNSHRRNNSLLRYNIAFSCDACVCPNLSATYTPTKVTLTLTTMVMNPLATVVQVITTAPWSTSPCGSCTTATMALKTATTVAEAPDPRKLYAKGLLSTESEYWPKIPTKILQKNE